MTGPRKVMEGLARRQAAIAITVPVTVDITSIEQWQRIQTERLAEVLEQSGFLKLLEAGERMYENCPIDALACAWKSALAQLERFAEGEKT